MKALVISDGSPEKPAAATQASIRIAQSLGAEVSVYYLACEYQVPQHYLSELAQIVIDQNFDGVLLSANLYGKELGAALAAVLDTALLQDVVALEIVDGALIATRPIYAGKLLARVKGTNKNKPVILTLRPGAFDVKGDLATPHPQPLSLGRGAPDSEAGVKSQSGVRGVFLDPPGKVDLATAPVVIAGGRGVGGPEGMKLLEQLADHLGGAVGATRAVVDAGWYPASTQIGQTGRTVSPRLYIACGISGAVQHLSGMLGSGCIVAINHDPKAAIFEVADYGLLGDLNQVLIALLAALPKV